MEEMQERPNGMGHKAKGIPRKLWAMSHVIFDRLLTAGEEDFAVVRREASLFFGIALTVIGLMNFQNGKNCDGNTADYLSCTRPSTFYYFGWFETVLVLFGVFFILLWILKRRHK